MPVAIEALEPDVLAAQQGDAMAFARLVDATSQLVSSITVAKLRDIDGSEDLTQEIYLAAWQSIHRLRNPASFLPWLKQLSRNQIHTAIRERQRSRSTIAGVDDDALIDSAIDASPTPGERLLAEEERRVVQECFEHLENDAREIITLYYREGKSIRQVAALLELKEATVKKRLERARNSLRAGTLERFAEVIHRTAPTAGLTAAVIASLTVGSASASASTVAGTVAAAPKAGTAGTTIALWPALLGLVLGVFGVLVYFHGHGRLVHEQSHDRIQRLALWSVGSVLLVCVGISVAALLSSPLLLLAAWGVGAAVHCWVYFVRLPRLHQHRPANWLRIARYLIPAFGLVVGTITVLYVATLR